MDILNLPYSIPSMLGEQYMLSGIIDELPDRVIYAAQQTDIRRDVIIECLRPAVMQDDIVVKRFVANARAKAKFTSKRVGVILELMYMDQSWHLVREKIKGEPLDRILAAGHLLSPFLMARLVRCLCRICSWMDVSGFLNEDFALAHSYLHDWDFRFDNPVIAGTRPATASRDFLRSAALQIMPLLDTQAPDAQPMEELLVRMRDLAYWVPLTPQEFSNDALQYQVTYGPLVPLDL